MAEKSFKIDSLFEARIRVKSQVTRNCRYYPLGLKNSNNKGITSPFQWTLSHCNPSFLEA